MWWRRPLAPVVNELAACRQALAGEQQRAFRLELALALTNQAKAKAEQDAQYWRERAERFIDQVGLRQGILSAPTMTEPPPSEDRVATIFDALGVSDVNRTHGRPAGSPATVVGVDPADAGRMVADLLQRTT